MAVRWYVMPLDTVVQGDITYRGPKYFRWRMNPAGIAVPSRGGQDFGLHHRWVGWADTTLGQHASLVGNSDVIGIGNTLGAADILRLRNLLDADGIPSNRLVNGTTQADALQYLARLAQFYQATHGELNRRVIDAEDLTAQPGQTLRDRFEDISQRRPLFAAKLREAIQRGDSLRDVIASAADAWGSEPVFLGGGQQV